MSLPGRLEFDLDPAFPATRSLPLRYAPAVLAGHLATEDLLAASQQEGARLIELGEYRGVRLLLLDETTCMKTGTYKSLDGCIATAMCRKLGISRAVFSSGANVGAALTDYAAKTGLESFFFCPAGTIHKLDGALFDRPSAHLIAVEGSDRRVKESARAFAEALDLPLIPRLQWRLLSAACRGLFIAEEIRKRDGRFSWFTQAVCAGYGPIGIYQALRALAAAGQIDRSRIPRLLAVQQAALCPIVRAWSAGQASLAGLGPTDWQAPPIEPSLYNVHPDKTYPMLYEILQAFGGDALAVAEADFDRHAGPFLDMLGRAGIRLTETSVGGKTQYVEKAGLLGGAGTLKAIADGRIAKGETVICALTGGAGPAPRTPAREEYRIPANRPPAEAAQKLASIVKHTSTAAEAPKNTCRF